MAGLFVLASAILAFKAALKNREAIDRSADTTDTRERESARQQRFTTIAEQLSDKDETIRLAGAYGLVALADEWDEVGQLGQRDVAIELICAYLRAHPAEVEDPEVCKVLLSAIGQHTKISIDNKWPGEKIDLSGVHMRALTLDNCDLSKATFDNSNFTGTILNGTKFDHCRLRGTDFIAAKMMEVSMQYAVVSGCDFKHATITHANLQNAKFTAWPVVEDADVYFMETYLSHASIVGAKVGGADFSSAILATSDSRQIVTLARTVRALSNNSGTAATIREERVETDDKTRWPASFDWEKIIEKQLQD